MKRQSFMQPGLIIQCSVACILSLTICLLWVPARSASAQSNAYVRVIHASPFIGTADVFVDGTSLLSSFQFASVTGYVPVPPGTHRVQIALVGKGIDAAVLTQDLPIEAGKTYTVAALGKTQNELSLQVFEEDNSVIPGRAKVRVYQLSPDAGTITVSVGEEHSLDDMTYPSASEYIDEDTGPCDFKFSPSQSTLALPLTTTLKANTVTSVFSVGLFAGDPKVQLVVAQVPGIPGMPGTGSKPTIADKVIEQPVLTLFLVALLLTLLGTRPALRYIRYRRTHFSKL